MRWMARSLSRGSKVCGPPFFQPTAPAHSAVSLSLSLSLSPSSLSLSSSPVLFVISRFQLLFDFFFIYFLLLLFFLVSSGYLYYIFSITKSNPLVIGNFPCPLFLPRIDLCSALHCSSGVGDSVVHPFPHHLANPPPSPGTFPDSHLPSSVFCFHPSRHYFPCRDPSIPSPYLPLPPAFR